MGLSVRGLPVIAYVILLLFTPSWSIWAAWHPLGREGEYAQMILGVAGPWASASPHHPITASLIKNLRILTILYQVYYNEYRFHQQEEPV